MTAQDLLDAGYQKYPAHKPNVEWAYQKRFTNDKGDTLYFITVYQYAHYIMGEVTYEAEIQLYQAETHEPLNLKFHGNWKLWDVEHYASTMYYMGMTSHFEPYEVCDGH